MFRRAATISDQMSRNGKICRSSGTDKRFSTWIF